MKVLWFFLYAFVYTVKAIVWVVGWVVKPFVWLNRNKRQAQQERVEQYLAMDDAVYNHAAAEYNATAGLPRNVTVLFIEPHTDDLPDNVTPIRSA